MHPRAPVQPPEQGQLVLVRARQWVVADVDTGIAAGPVADPQHLITLRCVDDDATPDETLQVVWEIEPDARIIERAGFPNPDHLDDPSDFDAFLDAVRWGGLSASNPRQLLAPFQSGVEIEPYQLLPLARAIEMARVSLLIADDVGLGKTIEAGLIIKELLLRYRARRMLIVAPADLTLQWRDEMQDKFGLEFRVVDGAMVKRLRRDQGLQANPWSHFPRLIASIDYLKQERVMRRFRETLPAPGEPRFPRPWDLLVVDEAHNIAPAGKGNYVTDSLRTQAIREIGDHFEHRIFLTATPHNGHDESFASLLNLLDPQRFARPPVMPSDEQKQQVMIRRMKSELPERWDGTPRFPPRRLRQVEVAYVDEDRRAHELLGRYSVLRAARAGNDGADVALDFVMQLLKKRLLSSPVAFANTLAVHRATITRPPAKAERSRTPLDVLRLYMDHASEAFEDDEEYRESQDRAHRAAGALLTQPTDQELAVLDELTAWAERASTAADAKAAALIELIEATCRDGQRWNDERIIVFTEYRDTQKWLYELLAARKLTRDDRVELIWGGMDDDARDHVKAAFQADPAESKVRVLIGTDAASEGINLQRHCHRVIHYEIPWNPVRLEQRNGRVDRHGQTKPVEVFHFVPAGWQELAERRDVPVGALDGDLEFLRRVVSKVEAIRDMLGSVGPVIAQQVSDAMLGRASVLDTAGAEAHGQRVRRQLETERRAEQRIDELVRAYDETRAELHLSPAHVEHVVSVALRLARQPALASAPEPGTCHMPALTGSWRSCTVGLSHPYTQVPRPITFDPSLIDGRDDLVLCHVGHRLVQMAIRLLRAEVFQPAEQRLARVTARLSDDPTLREPLVVAYARLVMTGAEGHRLHEEIIQAGGHVSRGKLVPLGVGALRDALVHPAGDPVDPATAAKLLALHPDLTAGLVRALRARSGERAASLRDTIDVRLREEQQRVAAVMHELERSIQKQLVVERQLSFDDPPEQLRLDRAALNHRLATIPQTIEQESANLARRFRDPESRVFPIAVEYRFPAGLVGR